MTLGDGRNLEAAGRGTVSLVLKSPGSEAKPRKLYDTLHVPDLSFNLVSVSKVTEAGWVVKFLEKECQFINSQKQVIARASRHGSLYLFDCVSGEQRHAAKVSVTLWHKRYGHLNAQSSGIARGGLGGSSTPFLKKKKEEEILDFPKIKIIGNTLHNNRYLHLNVCLGFLTNC